MAGLYTHEISQQQCMNLRISFLMRRVRGMTCGMSNYLEKKSEILCRLFNGSYRAFSAISRTKMTSRIEKALGETKLGVDAKKLEDFSAWYTQVWRPCLLLPLSL